MNNAAWNNQLDLIILIKKKDREREIKSQTIEKKIAR